MAGDRSDQRTDNTCLHWQVELGVWHRATTLTGREDVGQDMVKRSTYNAGGTGKDDDAAEEWKEDRGCGTTRGGTHAVTLRDLVRHRETALRPGCQQRDWQTSSTCRVLAEGGKVSKVK